MYPPNTKILIVDDMGTMRKIIMKACTELKFTTFVEAADGAMAWQKLTDITDIGFVISDWNMPNKSGIELLKMVRADSRLKGLPFMLVTAENDVEQVKEALVLGVDGYVVKPFAAATLAKKMEEIHKRKVGKAA